MQLKTQATGPGIGALDARYVLKAGDTMTGDLNMGANKIILHAVRADASDGILLEANNGTDVALFGAGNTSNSLFYGGVNVQGSTSLLPSSDIAPLVIKAGGTSTSIKSLDLQDSSGTSWFYVRKRLLSDANSGFVMDFQTSGTSATFRTGLVITMNAGYTGAEFTGALGFDNVIAGTATYYLADSSIYGYRPGGNRGIGGFSRASTVGHNIGGMMIAGGGAVNYGAWCASTVTKANGINVGLLGVAANASATNPAAIGVYATLYNTNTAPPNMSGIKTALLVDNQSFTDPIAIFRSNGTPFVSVEDTGDFLLGDRTSTTNLGTRFRIPATVTTTDATVTTVESFTTASDTSYTIHATITAVKSDGSQMGSYVLYASYRNDSGTLTQVGATTVSHTAEDDATWNGTLDVSGTTIRVRVTGVAATNIRWQSHLRISAVKY